jgi:RimJ/RimL family protein N-acetyltransferase
MRYDHFHRTGAFGCLYYDFAKKARSATSRSVSALIRTGLSIGNTPSNHYSKKTRKTSSLPTKSINQLVGMTGFVQGNQNQVPPQRLHYGECMSIRTVRGRRIGQALLQETIHRAQQLPGLKMITLTVTDRAPGAYTLYKNVGFEEFGREPHGMEWKGEAMDVIYMYRMLPS